LFYKIDGNITLQDGVEVPNLMLVYHHVDDFLVAGFSWEILEAQLRAFATEFPTTPPEVNTGKYLGVNISRERKSRAIMLSMNDKIVEACAKFEVDDKSKARETPMPSSGFVIDEEELDKLKSARKLSEEEKIEYMGLVGVLIWISTVRIDIKFSVMYLSWATQQPRQHHYEMGCKVLAYLFHTADLPLVLGGEPPLIVEVESDFSLGTGPKRRGILGYWARLSPKGGAVMAKCHTTLMTVTNVFQGELDGHVHAVKCLLAIENLLEQLGLLAFGESLAYTDNVPVQQYVVGDASVKLTKHMEIRLWFARDQHNAGKYSVKYRKSKDLTADMLTKIVNASQYVTLRAEMMGLWLVPEIMKKYLPNQIF
jgi:hypothetical protein